MSRQYILYRNDGMTSGIRDPFGIKFQKRNAYYVLHGKLQGLLGIF